MMKVDNVTKIHSIEEFNCELVIVGSYCYKRCDANNWIAIWGCTEEEVYDKTLTTELEQAYQEFNQKGK